MKIIKRIFPILLILGFLLTPFTSAFAYTGGLLDGKSIIFGSSESVNNGSTPRVTDNNESTNYQMGNNGSGDDTIWYEFPSVVTINSYKLKTQTVNSNINLRFYDSSGTQITVINMPNGTGVPTNISPVSNVKKVVITNGNSTVFNIYEFDVFASNLLDYSGLLDGKSLISSTDYGISGNSSNLGTDNLESTNVEIGNSGGNDTLYYSFSSPVDLTSFKIKVQNGFPMKVNYYDQNKNVIATKDFNLPSWTFTKYSLSASNVYGVAIINPNNAALNVYEFDVEGSSATFKTDLTNVDITGITKTDANISWSAPTGYSGVTLSGYKIYVDNVLKHTASPSSSSYSLTGLTADTSYTVKVVVSYSDGTETTGITKVFNTLIPEDETAPANVTNLVATPTFNSISLKWTNPTDQDFAKVNVYEDGIYKKSVTATEGSSANFSNLDPDTTYSFKVTSVDFTGNESSGAVIEVKTLPLPEVKKIKDLEATSKFDRVKLSWTLPESEYFHHVNIYRKVVEEESFFESLFSLGEIKVYAAEEEYKPMFETNGTYWTDLTVEPETKYEYKLTLENVDGRESTEAAVIQVETPEEPKPVLKGAEFQAETNGDYVVKWAEPTTGNIKIMVGGKDYKTVPANLKTYTIPKTDLAYTAVGDPDVIIQPVTERGTEGEVVSSPKMNLPFSAKDLVESGNGLLWLVGPFILLALAFLLVPKFRELILAAFRGKGKLIDTDERRSTTGDKELNLEPKGETVRLQKEPRESRVPRMKADRAEREVRIGREPRQAIREPRTPRVSRRGR
jgi:hypothetical protein